MSLNKTNRVNYNNCYVLNLKTFNGTDDDYIEK